MPSRRQPELDALRGLFLVWMTLTHLPTRMSDLTNQPFGFISSAEGFVFLSALLTSRLYYLQVARLDSHSEERFRAKLFRRAFQLYGFHLLMLLFAFTVAAGLALHSHRTALYNLLNFYLDHPLLAILGSIFLVYTPPLLDILPMYVLFLALTPPILSAVRRIGWRWTLSASILIWTGAQFGLRDAVHNAVVYLTHLPIPIRETGAFNLFSWQLLWIAGLYIGCLSAQPRTAENPTPLELASRNWKTWHWLTPALLICVFFIAIRHEWIGPAGHHWNPQSFGILLDKWQLGPLRMVNMLAFALVLWSLRRPVLKLVSVEPFLTLGRASLEVFCAHLFFVFIGLAFLYNDTTQLHGWHAIGLLALTFIGLGLVATLILRKRRREKEEQRRLKQDTPDAPPPPTLTTPPATNPLERSVLCAPAD